MKLTMMRLKELSSPHCGGYSNALSEVTHYGYIGITYNLREMLDALPCKWPRKNWENKELITFNGFGTTNTAFSFLSSMLIFCACYPHAICHVE